MMDNITLHAANNPKLYAILSVVDQYVYLATGGQTMSEEDDYTDFVQSIKELM